MNNSSRQQEIRISSGTIIRAILFVLLFIGIYILRDIVLVLLAAVVIASAIEPAAQWLENKGVPRIPGVLAMYLFVAAVIAGIFYFLIPPLVSDISQLIAEAPEYINSLQVGLQGSGSGLGAIEPLGGVPESFSIAELVTQFQKLIGTEGGVFSFITKIFGGMLSFVLVITFSFYLTVQRNGIGNFLRIVTPFQYEDYIIDLWERSQAKIGKWLQGQLILMLIVGLLTYLGLMIIGVNNALVFGLLAGLFEIIPLFGPVLSAIPPTAVAFVDGGVTLGILTVGLFVVIQQFENNLIHPLVVTKVVGVPPMLVIVAIVVGGKLAGFLGALLSVPLAAALMEYANDISKRKKELHKQLQGDSSA
jgi:predicted PurR-regulated permease PerM